MSPAMGATDAGASRHVGIDLAWKAKARTGLAAVGDDGRLLGCATVVTDDEIDTWLSGLDGQLVTVAVDAPLVVPNETGQRVGENLVAKAFGRYGASPYPSNRANPLFDPPRAMELADRHGWSVDPTQRGTAERPTCMEVYPHPAMVGLFLLGSVLPYKSGRGRTPQSRRAVFSELMDHLEAIEKLGVTSLDRWHELRQTVEESTRHMHLEAIEDELDAILCAHLAWLWHHQPAVLHVYGTLEEGYIVAPPAPGHPAVRARRTTAPAPEA